MSDNNKNNPFDFSDLLQLKDLLSDFSKAEQALKQHSSIILTDNGSWKYALMNMDEFENYLRMKKKEEDISQEKQLPILLNGVGNAFFVEFYENLKSKVEPDSFLPETLNVSKTSVRSRISRANAIFSRGWEIDALRHIINSSRTNNEIRAMAKCLLMKELKV